MDVRNNTNGSILPRQPNGNRDGSVRRANQQLGQAFSDSSSSKSNSPFKGGSYLLQLILNLIIRLLSQLAQKKPPVDKNPFPIRAVYGAAVAPRGEEGARGVYGGAIGVAPPKNEDPNIGHEGARGVYGGAIGVTGPASEDKSST